MLSSLTRRYSIIRITGYREREFEVGIRFEDVDTLAGARHRPSANMPVCIGARGHRGSLSIIAESTALALRFSPALQRIKEGWALDPVASGHLIEAIDRCLIVA